MEAPVLALEGIAKLFGGIAVLRDVDFDVRPGEVHALVGENGAGKSTLMKIASGVYQPDAGTMTLSGARYAPRNPFESLKAGVAMVHQELSLADDLSIAENILALREPVRFGMVRWRELYGRARAMMREFGLNASPDAPVSSLSIGYRQVVEILKALASNPRVVVFDEPTSSLEAHESALVLQTIGKLAARGIGVVYVSHRMDEVFQVASRVTVLRDGRWVATKSISETTLPQVVNAMVGRELSDLYPPKAEGLSGELLRVQGLSRRGSFEDVSFALRQGEILGFSGLVGSGRTELMRAIFGVDAPDAGWVAMAGRRLRFKSVFDAMRNGVAYVPEERKTLGLFLDRTVEDNVACACLGECSRRGLVRPRLTHDLAAEYCRKLEVKARDVEQEVSALSGGNQQKVLLARWMATQPKVLIVDEPTRGVDVGAKGEIHKMLREYASEGNGVIAVSSEMPEIIGLCDRVIVLREGRVAGEVPGAEATEERLIELAVGC
jgi:ABC-type sugar transport system ATPase subunit